MNPLIAITSYARDGTPLAFSVPCAYVDAVRAAGATPLVLPVGERHPDRLLDLVDGVLLSGGGDISPATYGRELHEAVYAVSEERDEFEFELTRAVLGRPEVPLLCICRGMQVLNVVCGGTLHVHVPERFGEDVLHRSPPRLPTQHGARIDPESRLGHMLGATEVEVCSWHHQAIDHVGDGLRAVAWAADGVIEAVEHTAHPWCFAVQWHPEMQMDEPPQRRLFEAFIAAANGRSRVSGLGSQGDQTNPGT